MSFDFFKTEEGDWYYDVTPLSGSCFWNTEIMFCSDCGHIFLK